MEFERATVTLVGGELIVLEYQLKRVIRDFQLGTAHAPPRPEMADVYIGILDKINAARERAGE